MAFVVLNKNADDQPESPRRRGQKTKNGQSRIAEKAKAGLGLHQLRGSNNERSQDESRRNPVGYFLDAFHDHPGVPPRRLVQSAVELDGAGRMIGDQDGRIACRVRLRMG